MEVTVYSCNPFTSLFQKQPLKRRGAQDMHLLWMSKSMLIACAQLFEPRARTYGMHLLRCARSMLVTCMRCKLLGMAETCNLKMSG